MNAELTCRRGGSPSPLPSPPGEGGRTVGQEVGDVLAAWVAAAVPPAVAREEKLDFLQFELGRLPQLDMPLTHRFTPGLYVREIFMPKGAIVISRVHKYEHPFVVSKGRVAVWSENDGWQFIEAPFTGITTPGTRRILFIAEDCIWTTFHCGDWPADTDPAAIVDAVTETPDVSYIGWMQAKAEELAKDGLRGSVALPDGKEIT